MFVVQSQAGRPRERQHQGVIKGHTDNIGTAQCPKAIINKGHMKFN